MEAVREWRGANIRPAKWSLGTNGTEQSDDARLIKAQADEREIKVAREAIRLAKERGEVIDKAEQEERESVRAAFYQRWALGLENEMAPRLVGLNEKEMRTVIRKLARDHLERMSKL